jgi:hypothetical protein
MACFDAHRNSQNYKDGNTLSEFSFIVDSTEHMKAIQAWTEILQAFYRHDDWSALAAFFTKRYGRTQMLSDRALRKLEPPPDASTWAAGKSATVNFLTDASAVGIPKDLTLKLAEACKKAHGRLIGPDPKTVSIGPALSLAFGGGAYMDLIYGGETPGTEPRFDVHERTGVATAKKGGRGRTAAEWAALLDAVAEWVYEWDATSLVHHFLTMHSYQYRLSDAEMAECRLGDKVPRKYLKTDAIEGADGLRDAFEQIAYDPTRFHGIEWDFLKLQAPDSVEQAFYRRFGPAPANRAVAMRSLMSTFAYDDQPHGYGEVPAECVKRCPHTTKGEDWEKWLLSVRGGDVIGVANVFQVGLRLLVMAKRRTQGGWALANFVPRRCGPSLISRSGLSSSQSWRRAPKCRIIVM